MNFKKVVLRSFILTGLGVIPFLGNNAHAMETVVHADHWGCRKMPENCLPIPPSDPPGSFHDVNPGGGGSDHDISEGAEYSARILRSMSCSELSASKDEYATNVTNDQSLLGRWQDTLKQTNEMIADRYYADTTLDDIENTTNAYCDYYEIEASHREENTVCVERPRNKPEKCTTPPPSEHELLMLQRCRDGRYDLATRRRGLDNLKASKQTAERTAGSFEKQLSSDKKILQSIEKEMRAKKCK